MATAHKRRVLVTAILALSIGTLGRYGIPAYASWKHSLAPLTDSQRQVVRFAIGKLADPATLAASSSGSAIRPIALRGENIGGSNAIAKKLDSPNAAAQYTVQAGDTLSVIASRYGLQTMSIAVANGLNNSNDIREGQVLLIPVVDASPEKLKAAEEQQRKLLTASQLRTAPASAPLPSSGAGTLSGGILANPLAGNYTYVSQYFSSRHKGVDFVTPTGTPALAVSGGCVLTISTGYSGGYGNMVIMDYGNGLSSLYGHLSVISVHQGQCLSAGEAVGLTGSTGNSTGPHLHFEIRTNGIQVDPLHYVSR